METTRASMVVRRLGAAVIDHLIFTFIVVMASFFFVLDLENPDFTIAKFTTLLVCGVVLYCCKDIVGGRSLGKRVLGLAVLEDDENMPSIGKLITRNLFMVIWPVEILLIFASKRKKKLGDRLVKTDVFLIKKKISVVGLVLSIVSIAVVFIGIFVVGIVQIIKQDSSYKAAIDYIRTSPEIRRIVGDEISIGFLPTGEVRYVNGYGNSDLTIKVRGDKKTIKVRIVMHKEPHASWEIDNVEY